MSCVDVNLVLKNRKGMGPVDSRWLRPSRCENHRGNTPGTDIVLVKLPNTRRVLGASSDVAGAAQASVLPMPLAPPLLLLVGSGGGNTAVRSSSAKGTTIVESLLIE